MPTDQLQQASPPRLSQPPVGKPDDGVSTGSNAEGAGNSVSHSYSVIYPLMVPES